MMGESLRNELRFWPGLAHETSKRRGLGAHVAILTVVSLTSTLVWSRSACAQAAAPPPSASPSSEGASNPRLQSTGGGEAALDERAQRHWGSGMAYLDEDDYPKALEAFEKAYELSGRPRILLAIAVTHERRGDLGQAIATLDEYLRLAPGADNATSIRAHRDELQAQHDEQLQQISEAKRAEASAEPAAYPVSETTSDWSATTTPSADQTPSAPHSSNLRWTAFGVGVASGVAATVSGLLAWNKYGQLEDGCGASGLCSNAETQSAHTMAWVSTVLSGVAVVGLGIGIWLTLDESDAPNVGHANAQRVHVGLAYRPSGLSSEVSWSF